MSISTSLSSTVALPHLADWKALLAAALKVEPNPLAPGLAVNGLGGCVLLKAEVVDDPELLKADLKGEEVELLDPNPLELPPEFVFPKPPKALAVVLLPFCLLLELELLEPKPAKGLELVLLLPLLVLFPKFHVEPVAVLVLLLLAHEKPFELPKAPLLLVAPQDDCMVSRFQSKTK